MFRKVVHSLLFLSTAVAVSIDDCPGYNASNVVSTSSRLTADLNLAGDACNLYSRDAHDLKLLVELQTGKPQYVNNER
jgi:alpha-glucosidase